MPPRAPCLDRGMAHQTMPQSAVLHQAHNVLVERDAARYLGLSQSFLRKSRRLGRGPVFLRIGRAVRFRTADLDAFLEARTVRPVAVR